MRNFCCTQEDFCVITTMRLAPQYDVWPGVTHPSRGSDYGRYSWLQDHPDYFLSHNQTFLLYHFGEIKPRSCLFWFILHRKSSHTPYLLYYNITLVHKFWLWLVQLTWGSSWLLPQSLNKHFYCIKYKKNKY